MSTNTLQRVNDSYFSIPNDYYFQIILCLPANLSTSLTEPLSQRVKISDWVDWYAEER